MKTLKYIAASILTACSLFAKEPIPVIPVSGNGTSTTTKLGTGYTTRTSDGKYLTTTQLGDVSITRDASGNTWRTTKVGNNYITQGPGGETQTTHRLGDNYITRDQSGKITARQNSDRPAILIPSNK